MIRTITQLLLIGFAMPAFLEAQSPTNLTQDIEWIAGFTDTEDIEEAYNFGRREEELQLGLAAESLGFLSLPAEWEVYSISQKALFLINDERVSRGGVDYGNGSVLGLPLDALEENMNNIAQNHANWLAANNEFSHTGENGWSPFDRIDNDPVLGNSTSCHEFLTRAENLTGFWSSTSSIPMPIERAIYGWLYEDASSSWGHREAVLLQNMDLSGNDWGYSNNYASPASEGFLGIGMVESINGDWNPYNFGTWVNAGTLVVMNVVDPTDAGSCGYDMRAPAPAALPVELIDFWGIKNKFSIDLTWFTASEKNNDYFSIQFSQNGKDFSEIGTVQGNGNSEDKQVFHFNHQNPVNGINYYRLEQFDLDGTTHFSKTIAVRFVKDWLASIYPNPVVGDILTLNLTADESQAIDLMIFNVGGRLVNTFQFNLENGLNQQKINTGHLSKGFYTLVVSNYHRREIIKFSIN